MGKVSCTSWLSTLETSSFEPFWNGPHPGVATLATSGDCRVEWPEASAMRRYKLTIAKQLSGSLHRLHTPQVRTGLDHRTRTLPGQDQEQGLQGIERARRPPHIVPPNNISISTRPGLRRHACGGPKKTLRPKMAETFTFYCLQLRY